MNSRTKMLMLLCLLASFGALFAGCNIFDFASDAEKPLIEKVEDAIRDGNYALAKRLLADAVEDSTDAQALYYDAKATLLEAGIEVAEIVELIEGSKNSQQDGQLDMLNIVDNLSNEEKTAWYQANVKVSANLQKIIDGDAVGPFAPEDVALGYTVSNLMAGVFGIRDTNRDGIIDDNDFDLNLNFIETATADGYAFDGGTFLDGSGNIQEFEGLEVFLGELAGKQAFAAKTASAAKGKKGYTPDDINNLIVYVLYMLDNSVESLTMLIKKNITSFDPEKIDGYVAQIAAFINFYWYDDGIDNDDDGRTDEETINGQDDDGDGLVDEDTKYHPGADPTNDRNEQYLKIWQKWRNR